MRLRTLVGALAGQVQDYSYEAGRHALATGLAAPMEVEPPRPVAEMTEGLPVHRRPTRVVARPKRS